MKTRRIIAALLGIVIAGAGLAWWSGRENHSPSRSPQVDEPAVVQSSAPLPERPRAIVSHPIDTVSNATSSPRTSPIPHPLSLTREERLLEVRKTFSELAGGDPKTALTAARQVTDQNEREIALLTLVTGWRHGELRDPRQRAAAIASFGIEAGLGLELSGDPGLAVLWANQLTEGDSRLALLRGVAIEQLGTDPASALGMADQFSGGERRSFLDSIVGAWATKDTDAALTWADQLPQAEDRDAALKAIRQVAPVGIGTQISVEDGYPVIGSLFPGTPAATSGQIHPGDRIVGVAQGDSRFVAAGGMPLSDLVQLIRGAPGTTVQLQILPADAEASAPPRTVSIVRDQIRHKQ